MPSNNPESNRRYQKEFRARMSAEEKKEFDKQRYQRNKKSYNRRSREWAKKNPLKSQAAVHNATVRKKYPHTNRIENKDLYNWLLKHKEDRCKICGMPGHHIDHIVPLSRGGNHTFENIQMLCGTCNRAKRDLLPEELQDWLNHLLKHNIELINTIGV